MKTVIWGSLAAAFCCAAATACAETAETPQVNDPALKVELYAQEPMIQQPIGITMDHNGRLLVVQSNTHFPPKDYTGLKHDRVLWLRDTNGDERADRADVFFEGTDMTMDIATAPDGSIYLSTRDEILRLHDDKQDGPASRVDRKIVFMDTTARYPHNGISGLAFDNNGGLYFGVGENLGAAYTITGTDASKCSSDGDGGSIYHIDENGGRLRRVATGFWNPFGVCLDSRGNVFATDNDPDSRPPCRLHHVIEGGDYGFEFRYGRSGLHPFQSWFGELPGTLPMIAGIGEAPGEVVEYEPPRQPAGGTTESYRGLPSSWVGQLLVASWSDHTIEAYRLPDRKHPFADARKTVLVQGGIDFRPVGIAVAPDGSLYISDWVKRSYELHGFGRVWHVLATKASTPPPAAVSNGIDEKQRQLSAILDAKNPTLHEAKRWLAETNGWLFSAAITRIARDPALARQLAGEKLQSPRQRAGLLLISQRLEPNPVVSPVDFLQDADATVRLLAVKWISDDRIASAKPYLEKLLTDPTVMPAVFYGAITAIGRIESADLDEAGLLKLLKKAIADPGTPDKLKREALEIMSDRDSNLQANEIPTTSDPVFREWLVRVLGTLHDGVREPALRALAWDDKQPAAIRAAALANLMPNREDIDKLVTLAQTGAAPVKRAAVASLQAMPLDDAQQEILAKLVAVRGEKSASRPPYQDIEGWKKFLAAVPGKPDLGRGREVFLSPRMGSCITCHRMEGIGSTGGPNLSTIGSSKAPDYILESILQPNREVAPQYEAFMLTTDDGESRLAFELAEHDDRQTYAGIDGKTFDVQMARVVKRERQHLSIMPEGLVNNLSDEEFRDLVAFLQSCK